jgi:hypothetical protein
LSICADAADDAKIKVKAAIAANVLDIAALLLMKRVEDADASLRQTLRGLDYSASAVRSRKSRRALSLNFFVLVGKFCGFELLMRSQRHDGARPGRRPLQATDQRGGPFSSESSCITASPQRQRRARA